MADELNLFESLYADSNEDDSELEMISQMFQHKNFSELSKYYDISNYNNSFSTPDSHILSVIHVNLRSVKANVDKMFAMMHALKSHPDVLAISEHWLTENNKDSFFIHGYKHFHVVRSRGIHGGVSLFIRNNIQTDLVSKFSYSNKDIEICTVAIQVGNQKFNIVAVYRPSSKHKQVDKFTEIFSTIMKDNFFAKSDNLLLGDFNINLLEHQTHQETGNFLAVMQSLNYIPIISRPTRFPEGNQRGNPSLLDHIYVNFTLPSISGIIQFDLTDHLPIFVNILLPQKQDNLNYKIKFRDFNENNQALFTRRLCGIVWEDLLSADGSADDNFNIFFNTF